MKSKLPFKKRNDEEEGEEESTPDEESSDSDRTSVTGVTDTFAEEEGDEGTQVGNTSFLHKLKSKFGKKKNEDEDEETVEDSSEEQEEKKPKKFFITPIQGLILIGIGVFLFTMPDDKPEETGATPGLVLKKNNKKAPKAPEQPADATAQPSQEGVEGQKSATEGKEAADTTNQGEGLESPTVDDKTTKDPQGTDTASTPEESVPSTTDTTTPPEETVPATTDTTITPEETVPSTTDTTTTPEETVPPTTDTTLSPEETIPSDTDTTSDSGAPDPEGQTTTEGVPQTDSPDTPGEVTGMDESGNLTDKILEDLEKQAKDSQVKEVKKEYVSPPDYEYRGRGLVYNCKGKHWACVDGPSYKMCEDNASSTKYLKKPIECYPFNVYQTQRGCESMQDRMVSSSAKTTFCNE